MVGLGFLESWLRHWRMRRRAVCCVSPPASLRTKVERLDPKPLSESGPLVTM